MSLYIHLCCNDPRNGHFCGRLAAFEFGTDSPSTWETSVIPEPRMGINAVKKPIYPGHKFNLRVGCETFHLGDGRDWVGNWCWDAYQIPGLEIVRLLNAPKIRSQFQCTEAAPEIFDAWQHGQPFTADMLKYLA